ncbi:putative phosphinothricin acetyltransferase YwnH [bioreactor metagenome]|uniref:Putative phosphinothricin acetyltransferase YwnH n=1 Tax=bioreactor metagenome TaxID=1076179 RepID=A0A645GUX0_9ZZZZ
MSPISSRCVYAGVADISVYAGEKFKGLGVGTALLNELIRRSEDEGFWTLQSHIIKENTASRVLHLKCGFHEVGIWERLGRMDNGKWHDVVIMERRSKIVG